MSAPHEGMAEFLNDAGISGAIQLCKTRPPPPSMREAQTTIEVDVDAAMLLFPDRIFIEKAITFEIVVDVFDKPPRVKRWRAYQGDRVLAVIQGPVRKVAASEPGCRGAAAVSADP